MILSTCPNSSIVDYLLWSAVGDGRRHVTVGLIACFVVTNSRFFVLAEFETVVKIPREGSGAPQ